MRIASYISMIFLFQLLFSCAPSIYQPDLARSDEFVNIKRYGVKGDGKTNDQPAIQIAFQSGHNLYFPKGEYVLKTKTEAGAILLITEQGTPRRIRFAKGAIFVVAPDQPTDYIKPAVVSVEAKRGDIPFIEWDGLSIEGNRGKHKINNSGLIVLDHKGTKVERLILRNATVKNVGWNAIYSQAMHNEFYNIRTENSGLHGIALINYSHPKEVGTVLIDGFESKEDKGYSIDFSGPKDQSGKPYSGYAWRAIVKHVSSFHSQYGIKTAGHWDIDMEDVSVEGSDNHGFFINVENRGHVIVVKNMSLKNNKGVALNLRGYGRFVGEDIRIENCGKGMLDGLTDIHIRDLQVKGGPLSRLGIQIGGPVKEAVIDGFTISGLPSIVQYPLRLKGKNIVLKNGVVKNNRSVFEILVYPEAGSVKIEDVRFSGSEDPLRLVHGIRTLQSKGKLELKGLDFRAIQGVQVRGSRDKIQLEKCKGVTKVQWN